MKLNLTPYQILTTWPASPKKVARGVARPDVRSQQPTEEMRELGMTWESIVPATPNHLLMMWGV